MPGVPRLPQRRERRANRRQLILQLGERVALGGGFLGFLLHDLETRFGIDEPVSEVSVQQMLDRIIQDRQAGTAFAFLVTIGGIGLAVVKRRRTAAR